MSKEHIGRRTGMLKIIDAKYEDGAWRYTAKCDCGNIITLSHFQIFRQISCGCIRKLDRKIFEDRLGMEKYKALDMKKVTSFSQYVDSLMVGETFTAKLAVGSFDMDVTLTTEERTFTIANKYRAYMKVTTDLNGKTVYCFVNYKDLWMRKEKTILISRGEV